MNMHCGVDDVAGDLGGSDRRGLVGKRKVATVESVDNSENPDDVSG